MSYIEREKYVKLNDIIETLEHEWGYEGMREDLYNLPTADVVSREVFEQVKWERDTALQTLEEHGIGLGQKADVVKVKHGEWLLRSFLPTSTQKYPYKLLICSQCCEVSKNYTKYCPKCGAKMDKKAGTENE